MKVDALNYPEPKLIRFNYMRVLPLMVAPRLALQLVVHEFLGVARIDDRDYSISQKVLGLSGESVLSWTCESEAPVENSKLVLSYQAIDYSGDHAADETILSIINTKGESQQVPLMINEVDLNTPDIKGRQILWSPLNAINTYQIYLPQEKMKKASIARLPFYAVSPSGADKLENPDGFLKCYF